MLSDWSSSAFNPEGRSRWVCGDLPGAAEEMGTNYLGAPWSPLCARQAENQPQQTVRRAIKLPDFQRHPGTGAPCNEVREYAAGIFHCMYIITAGFAVLLKTCSASHSTEKTRMMFIQGVP